MARDPETIEDATDGKASPAFRKSGRSTAFQWFFLIGKGAEK